MEVNIVYEIIGYVASVLIAVSLMMKAIIKLRVINLIGAATFSVYGMLIGSIPVAAMNGFIVLINIYFLYQMFTAKEYFKLIQLYPNSKMLRHFLDFYAHDIAKYVPDFSYEDTSDTFALFVLRDMVPAGLLLGKKTDDGSLILELDYVIPNYRDFKIGRYIYEKKRDFLSERGIKRIICHSKQPIHMQYLKKMGFEKSGSEFELKL
jgi:GNAT superfamily N-acetyltransferase